MTVRCAAPDAPAPCAAQTGNTRHDARTGAGRVRRALQYLPPERVIVNPDCGLRRLSGEVARAKLRALTAGVATVREETFGDSRG